MENFSKVKTFFLNNILYFVFGVYFSYMLGFYFFSELIPLSLKNFSRGYFLSSDSSRYIENANNLINFNKLPEGKAIGYLGYIFFIAIFQYFELNLTFVVIFQIILTFLSSICIYKISKKFSSHLTAVFAISLYLFYLPLQMYNFYILTETIFICLIIFILYFVIFFQKKFLPLLIFLIIFGISLRPHGFILIPALISSLLLWFYLMGKFNLFYVSLISLVILFFPIMSLLNIYLENEKIVNKIIEKGIIWEYQSESNYLNYNTNFKTGNNFLSLLILLKENIYTFTLAFFKKIWISNLRIRPYYSDFHNYYIIFFNLIYWPTAILGMLKMFFKFNNIGIIIMYFLIFFFTLSIGFSWADWDGRFSLYILPLIFIFSAIGLNHIVNNKTNILNFKI